MSLVSCPECGATNVYRRVEKDEYECLRCGHKWPVEHKWVWLAGKKYRCVRCGMEKEFEESPIKPPFKERRFGKPRTEEERKERHKERYGTEELPPRGTEREPRPRYLTKERVKHLYALIMANHICVGYYGPEAKKARAECVSREYKRIYSESSKNIDEFAEKDPEGFRKWLRNLERGWGIE